MTPILADVILPLVTAGFLQLTVGNFIIGIVEAFIVRRRYKVQMNFQLWASIILANYFSCIVGWTIFYSLADSIVTSIGGPLPVYSIGRVMLILILVSFASSIVLEWPFYWLALRKRPEVLGRSLPAAIFANTGSYMLLLAWFWAWSSTPLQWGVKLVEANQLTPIPTARIFYIAPNGQDVMQIRLDGSTPTRFCRLPQPNRYGILGFSEEPTNGSLKLQIQDGFNGQIEDVADIGPGRVAVRQLRNDHNWTQSSGYKFPADDLDPLHTWSTKIDTERAYVGIQATRNSDNSRFPIMAVDLPGLGWIALCPTVLPSDQVVFQFGEQILRADLKSKRAAGIVAGQGPVVVLDK